MRFNGKYLNIKSPAYLKGYWQSENYFKEFERIIKEDFQVKTPATELNYDLLQKIRGTESVSLHIRRGNFVNVDFVNKFHGTCSMDYYKEAISTIAKHWENPVFYVFSDDIEWAKTNMNIKYESVFVDINSAKQDYEDLRLMQNCSHNILANSTFSWWGAWLNTNPNKIIIAPKQWFADEQKNIEAKTIIPPNWFTI